MLCLSGVGLGGPSNPPAPDDIVGLEPGSVRDAYGIGPSEG
jgi:hypothetical protein